MSFNMKKKSVPATLNFENTEEYFWRNWIGKMVRI